ncbi:MAG: HugZ family protein [Opitutales bacterium]
MSNDSSDTNEPSPPDTDPTVQSGLAELFETTKTANLGSVSAQGIPSASYAPYIMDEAGNFYIYISALAKHTANIKRSLKTSFMLIEDEAQASSLFARKRVTWDCEVEPIERDGEEFNVRISDFEETFGDIMNTLANMTDFSLFRLKPCNGVLVLGFGQAFRLSGHEINQHLQGRHSSGHKIKKSS